MSKFLEASRDKYCGVALGKNQCHQCTASNRSKTELAILVSDWLNGLMHIVWSSWSSPLRAIHAIYGSFGAWIVFLLFWLRKNDFSFFVLASVSPDKSTPVAGSLLLRGSTCLTFYCACLMIPNDSLKRMFSMFAWNFWITRRFMSTTFQWSWIALYIAIFIFTDQLWSISDLSLISKSKDKFWWRAWLFAIMFSSEWCPVSSKLNSRLIFVFAWLVFVSGHSPPKSSSDSHLGLILSWVRREGWLCVYYSLPMNCTLTIRHTLSV